MATIDGALAVATQAGATESPQARPSARAWYALVAMIIAILFAVTNNWILTLGAGPIKADLSLTDLQLGETKGLAPAIFAMVAIYPLAWLADRFERRTVLCCCILFWSLATAVSGFAWNFTTLLAFTIAIVIGEAGASPIFYSILADLFPGKYRPRANIIAYGAMALGGGLTLVLMGMLFGAIDDLRLLLPAGLQGLENWRLAFFFVALPGPLVALAVFLIGPVRRKTATVHDPAAATRQEPAPMAPIRPYIREHGLVVLGVFGTMGLFNFALQGISAWMPIAFIRAFGADPASVGIQFGLCFMAGTAVGLATAVILTPYYRRRAGTAFVLRAISFAAAGTAIPVLLLTFATHLWQCYALVAIWSAIAVTGVSLMPSMMQDVAPDKLRTRVIGVGTVVFTTMGAVSAPLIGFISDQSAGDPRGLLWSVVSAALAGFLACSVLARLMENRYRRTVAAAGQD